MAGLIVGIMLDPLLFVLGSTAAGIIGDQSETLSAIKELADA